MGGALDKKYGAGRVDLIALNGYFINQTALQYVVRELGSWDQEEAFETMEQVHFLGTAMDWQREMAEARRHWPNIPITCYEGGQHLANPFDEGLQGDKLVTRMKEVNASPKIKQLYRTALETWHLAGGDSFTPFVDVSTWGKYGCWGHLQYTGQPLEDVIDPETGNVTRLGAHKYVALLEYAQRWRNHDPDKSPKIVTTILPEAKAGEAYEAKLEAQGGTRPHRWSLLGGRLPNGLKVEQDGRIVGVPEKPEQLAFIVDCTDAKGQHASIALGLFMIPPAMGKVHQVDFSQGMPAGSKVLDSADGPYTCLLGTETKDKQGKPAMSNYSAELVFSPSEPWNQYHFAGLVVNSSPDGDSSDLINIVVRDRGRKLSLYSRYVHNSPGEIWYKRDFPLIADLGEDAEASAVDVGENWTIRATVRPGVSPGAMDLLIGVFDQDGKPRLDGANRFDVANGMLLIRELMVKKELRTGPLGVIGQTPKTIRYWQNR